MSILVNLSKKITQLNKSLETGQELGEEVIYFGLRLLVMSILNIVIILGVALILDIFWTTLAALLAGSTLRVFSGGAHATSQGKCIFIGTVIYIALGGLAQWVGSVLGTNVALWSLVSVYSVSTIFALAPVEAKNKPLNAYAQRKRLKRLSRGIVLAWVVIAILGSQWGMEDKLVYGVLFGLLWQSSSLWPITYKLMEKL